MATGSEKSFGKGMLAKSFNRVNLRMRGEGGGGGRY